MQLVTLYESLKTQAVTWVGITNAEFHIHAGMLIYLATALILRKPLRSPIPLLAVIAAEAANEYLDFLASSSWRWPDTSRDALFTLLWPIAIFTLARLRKLRVG